MTDTHSPNGPPDHGQVLHEESDINIAAIFKFLAGLTVFAAFVQLLVWFLMVFFEAQAAKEPIQYPLAIGQRDRIPPEPRLQVDPLRDFSAYQAREQGLLDGYRWVDKDAGVVRIPIEQAMKLVVEQGIPTRSIQESGQSR